MEELKQKNNKNINKSKKEEFKENKNTNDLKTEEIIFNYDMNDPNSKRSYSCIINEPTTKKFSGCEEIKLNINKKYLFLKTPQIKPKKGELNPIPLNIGIASKKNSRFKPINDDSIDKNIFNDIISEGEKELSHKDSSISSSDLSEKEEEKENSEINNDDNEQNDDIENGFPFLKIHSENKIYSLSNFKIKEEKEDEFNEKGDLILNNVRRKMFQTKKTFLKNDRDYFNIMNNDLDEKYKKFKEDILMPKKKEDKLHNTISFTKPKYHGLSILDFLRKKSSIDKNKQS